MDSNESTLQRDRVVSFYKQLAASALQLNAASDELGKWIAALDSALKKLNLGISAWVDIDSGEDPETGDYWSRKVGYDKIEDRWGIAISGRVGNENADFASAEEWLFNDAPRRFRIEAVEKLPELLESLIEEADETTQSIRAKIAYVQELAAAVSEAARPAPPHA